MRRGLGVLCVVFACLVPASAQAVNVVRDGSDHLTVSAVNAGRITWTTAAGRLLITDTDMRSTADAASGCTVINGDSQGAVNCPDTRATVLLAQGNDVFVAPSNNQTPTSGCQYCPPQYALDVHGGRGNDVITGGYVSPFSALGDDGQDTLTLGPQGGAQAGFGDDRVVAVDGGTEVFQFSCGGGNDTAVVDLGDIVASDCETVIRVL